MLARFFADHWTKKMTASFGMLASLGMLELQQLTECHLPSNLQTEQPVHTLGMCEMQQAMHPESQIIEQKQK
jgi:glycine cleavage system pyridoxal-binding protein P